MRLVEELYFNRKPDSIKSDYGKALIIGGSKKYPNAPLISSMFCETSGAGYVALSVPQGIYQLAINRLSLNAICEDLGLGDDFSIDNIDTIKRYDSVLFGNGVNQSLENKAFLTELIKYAKALVIDGTGLSIVAEYPQILARTSHNKILLTPHIGELKRLLKIDSVSRNPKDYLEQTQEFCLKYQVNILIKSNTSILVLEDGTYKESNYPSTPSLARAGSGDALAGFITGLLAYGTKKLSFTDVVLGADLLFHVSALNLSLEYGDGLLTAPLLNSYLIKLIRESKKSYYLAYGSNLNLNKMKDRAPSAKKVGSTILKGYKLKSYKYLDLKKDPSSLALVGVFSYDLKDEILLDKYEDYPRLYHKEEIPFLLDNKYQIGLIYFMNTPDDTKPSQEYVKECLEGYRDFSFPEDKLLEVFKETGFSDERN